MADLHITHSHRDGTLIEGTSRGDGSAEILKAHRWRWGRSIGAWFIPQSRDRLAKSTMINATVAALESAGHTVTVHIDDAPRRAAEVEADKKARASARAAALAAKAERRDEQAEAATRRTESAHAALPPMGEPIKVGHHSEGRHRRAVDRAWTAWSQEVRAHKDADEARRRAQEAAAAYGARTSVVTVANRIERLTADLRRAERQQAGGRQVPELEQLRDQLAYWQQVRADQIAAGTAADYGPDTVRRGDLVQIGGSWFVVERANKKTVRVARNYLYPVGGTVPWYKVQAHRPNRREE
jgi:hypothetical protein